MPIQDFAIATNSVLSPILDVSIRHSRKKALQDDPRAIPDNVRSALKPFFDKDALDRVRWTVSSDRPTLDTLIASAFPRYRALTLGDTIVFMNEADSQDVGLWTHEMFHVEQIRKMGGTSRFSRVYLASWAEIEAETVQRTNEVLEKMNAPVRQSAPRFTNRCARSPVHAAEPV